MIKSCCREVGVIYSNELIKAGILTRSFSLGLIEATTFDQDGGKMHDLTEPFLILMLILSFLDIEF